MTISGEEATKLAAKARAISERHPFTSFVPKPTYEELKSLLDAATEDADRYRWLRDHGGEDYIDSPSKPQGTRPCIYMRLPSFNASGSYVLRGILANQVVDDAISKWQEEQAQREELLEYRKREDLYHPSIEGIQWEAT